MKQRVKIAFKVCSDCGKRKDTRALCVRWQDFDKTYSSTFGGRKKYDKFWIYRTQNFDLCRSCQKKMIKRITKEK